MTDSTIATRSRPKAPAALFSALAGALVALPLLSPAALAQDQRICVVDQQTNRVACGRVATRSEVSRSDYGRGNRNDDRFGNRRYETRDTAARRDWSDIYDELDDIYKEVLGRNIDNNGIRTYVDRLERGWSLAQVRQDVAESREAEQALDQLYRRVLGRGIDGRGLETYQRKIARGDSLGDVERELRRSDEARRR